VHIIYEEKKENLSFFLNLHGKSSNQPHDGSPTLKKKGKPHAFNQLFEKVVQICAHDSEYISNQCCRAVILILFDGHTSKHFKEVKTLYAERSPVLFIIYETLTS